MLVGNHTILSGVSQPPEAIGSWWLMAHFAQLRVGKRVAGHGNTATKRRMDAELRLMTPFASRAGSPQYRASATAPGEPGGGRAASAEAPVNASASKSPYSLLQGLGVMAFPG